MKKQYLLFLILTLVIVTGCRRNQPENTEPIVDSVTNGQGGSVVTNVQNLPSNDVGLGALVSGDRITVEEPESFVNTELSYENVTEVNVGNWVEYFNDNYGLAFSFPSDYIVFEDDEGDIIVTGEGAGDFFIVLTGFKGEFDNPVRTSKVLINGDEFTIEEFNRDGIGQLSYVVQNANQQYRFLYTFTERDEFIDLFNRVMQTVRFF